MCGIYGITAKNSKFINQYIDKCNHRGPDGRGTWHDDTVTLGHNLLSIMADPGVSRQPWITPKGNILVYNGEIFNYYELKIKYKQFIDTTGCDTELLAWGLDKFGIKFINDIDSMHGFAYYEPNKKQLMLSRDHAGVKPLYYAEIKEGLVFGSEVRGLLDKVPGARKLDKMAYSTWHYMSANPSRNTFFSNIKKLLPGETIIYDLHNKKIKQRQRDWIKPTSEHKYDPIEFRQVVNESVKRCSIGNKKIGLFLSGGMDSSMIARELLDIRGEVNSFTTRFAPEPLTDAEDYNEDATLAKRMANEFKYNHTEIEINPEIYAQYWDKSITSVEQSIGTPTLPANLYANKVMKDHKIKVTLAGDLGDELMCGYPRHSFLEKRLRGLARDENTWKTICETLITDQNKKRKKKINKDIYTTQEVLEEFMKQYPDDLFNDADPLGSFCALEVVAICPEEMLIRNDKFGMAYSMEGRYPLATKKFMKYCMSVPSNHKISDHLKHMSRDAYKDLLPDYITTKGKTGWTAPMAYWIKDSQSLLDLYERKLKRKINLPLIITQRTGKQIAREMMWATWFDKFNTENY